MKQKRYKKKGNGRNIGIHRRTKIEREEWNTKAFSFIYRRRKVQIGKFENSMEIVFDTQRDSRRKALRLGKKKKN